MKKSFLALGLSLVVLFSFSLVVQAQTGKEIIEPVTSTWYGTYKNLPLEKDCIFQTWEAFGIVMSETGKGLFHGATVRCMGSLYIDNGVFRDDLGYGVYVLQTGDKAFFRSVFNRKRGEISRATTTLIGGTGKCAGIKGSWDLTAYPLKPAMDGIFQSYNKLSIRYTLP